MRNYWGIHKSTYYRRSVCQCVVPSQNSQTRRKWPLLGRGDNWSQWRLLEATSACAGLRPAYMLVTLINSYQNLNLPSTFYTFCTFHIDRYQITCLCICNFPVSLSAEYFYLHKDIYYHNERIFIQLYQFYLFLFCYTLTWKHKIWGIQLRTYFFEIVSLHFKDIPSYLFLIGREYKRLQMWKVTSDL